jgi:hypothetical protein
LAQRISLGGRFEPKPNTTRVAVGVRRSEGQPEALIFVTEAKAAGSRFGKLPDDFEPHAVDADFTTANEFRLIPQCQLDGKIDGKSGRAVVETPHHDPVPDGAAGGTVAGNRVTSCVCDYNELDWKRQDEFDTDRIVGELRMTPWSRRSLSTPITLYVFAPPFVTVITNWSLI